MPNDLRPTSMELNDGPSGMSLVIAAVALAAGLVGGAYFLGSTLGASLGPAFVKGKLADRVVTVKGLSERQVKADLALWDIAYTATGDDLGAAQTKVESDTKIIHDFLTQNGLPAESVTPQQVEVVDLMAQQYRSEGASQSRFIVTASLLVRSGDVDLVQSIARKTGDLIKQGVIFAKENSGSNTPYYLFTRLNDVKLDMIAEATKNARDAADQFAADSGAHIGAIYRANQGQFSILPGDNWPGADESRQINKTVRVVATVDYMLTD